MSGHSKWAGIKHKKAVVDAKRGQAFTRASREITLAAREGGGDIDGNFRLRLAVQKAREVNMPADRIQAAIDRGTGAAKGESLEELRYEGYGPAGIAFIIEMATDNLNRSAADMRTIFTRNNGSVATQGSVSYQFDRKGEIRIPATAIDEDRLMETAIDCGADDVQSDDEEHIVFTAPNELGTVANSLRAAGLPLASEKLVSISQNPSVVADAEIARQILKLHDQLDDYPDTVNVFTNFEVADDILEQLGN